LDVLTTASSIVHLFSFLAYDHANDGRARGYEQAQALGFLWVVFRWDASILHFCTALALALVLAFHV
jgi:hypothetical protein